MNLLLEGNNGLPTWGLLIILIVAMVIMIIPTIIRNKKMNTERQNTISSLKVGAKIITTAGVFGKIISMRETTMGKVFVIETGDDKNKSYMEIHENAIMNIDDKRDIILDADGNDITFADEDKAELEQKEADKAEVVEEDKTTTEETVGEKESKTTEPKKAKKATKSNKTK